jgi:regulatory protein
MMKKRPMKTKASEVTAQSEEAAREQCLRLLAIRPRSANELRRRLKSSRFEDRVVESVLAGLAQAGLVDDEDFARAWVASRQASGAAGHRKLRWELRRKGIAEDIIRTVVDEGIDDEAEFRQALELARRRLRGSPAEPKTLARLQRLLSSRGFRFDTVEAVVRRILIEEEQ